MIKSDFVVHDIDDEIDVNNSPKYVVLHFHHHSIFPCLERLYFLWGYREGDGVILLFIKCTYYLIIILN